MSHCLPKRRNALDATLSKLDAKEKSLGSPTNARAQPGTPTTPAIRASQPTLSPEDTFKLGDYTVSVDAFIAYGLKLETNYVESYQVTIWSSSGKDYEGKKTCTLRKIPLASAALKKACEDEKHILTRLAESEHPNVIHLLDCAFSDRSTPNNPPCWDIFYLFADLEVSNLSRIVADHRRNRTMIAEEEIIRIAIDLVDTLAFLHASTPPLLHRNIRPSSIIRTSFGAFKLSSFLSAAFPMAPNSSWEVDQLLKLDMGCYTDPKYRSPEMTERHDYRRRDVISCTAESDLIFKKDPMARPTAQELQTSLRQALEIPPFLYKAPPLVFSPETKELLTMPRQSYKLADHIGKETPFWDPSQLQPLPTSGGPTTGLGEGSTSSRDQTYTNHQGKDGTLELDVNAPSLLPPPSYRHSRSKSASPRLPVAGLNRVEFSDGKDGLINIPSISISPSDEAFLSAEVPNPLHSALFVPVGYTPGPDQLRPLQSPQLRLERSQSSRRTNRSHSDGSRPRPNLTLQVLEENSTSAPRRPANLSSTFNSEDALEDAGSRAEVKTSSINGGEDQEPVDQEGTTSPDDDIGHLVTITSLEAVFVNGRFSDIFEGIHKTMGRVALKRPRIGGTGDEKDIIRFLGTFKSEKHIYFVSPFIRNGTLLEYVKEHHEVNRVKLLCETADAIHYLHLNKVVHGDIKASNILISDEYRVLLCDFGLTKVLHSKTSTVMKRAGTIRWQSPELWDDAAKTFKSDVYAFSMTIVEVITGAPPFSHLTNDMAILMAVYGRQERPQKTPTEFNGVSYENAWAVAEACWKTKPAERIRISEAFRRLRKDPSLV
ncbi:hypothetical protein FRC04_002356 [Tulasnella sp. 424]|nr:hypothetical protein FRC04_002356 [Tulasnella sp. 424]